MDKTERVAQFYLLIDEGNKNKKIPVCMCLAGLHNESSDPSWQMGFNEGLQSCRTKANHQTLCLLLLLFQPFKQHH